MTQLDQGIPKTLKSYQTQTKLVGKKISAGEELSEEMCTVLMYRTISGGWVAQWDNEYGRWFYYNRNTGFHGRRLVENLILFRHFNMDKTYRAEQHLVQIRGEKGGSEESGGEKEALVEREAEEKEAEQEES